MSVPLELPEQIDQVSFVGGFAPDMEPAAAVTFHPYTGTPRYEVLSDMLNLLPDPQASTLVTRKGFARISDDANLLGGGFHVRHLFFYASHSATPDEGGDFSHRNLIAVLTDFSNDPNNVQIWAYDLADDTAQRIDTPGRVWAGEGAYDHWNVSILGTMYGGQRGESIYSWNPIDGWVADASIPNVRTLIDGVDAAVNTDNQYGRDFAFREGSKVKYGATYYVCLTDNRFKVWNSGDRYERGDKVTLHQAWGQSGTQNYWKSFKCIKGNTADGTNRPGNGSGSWQSFWQPIRLDLPLDDDSEVTDDWDRMPVAAKSAIGTFHANRLWLRWGKADGSMSSADRLQFSAPIKPEHGKDIAVESFDATNFAPSTDLDGDGGGWIDFHSGDGDFIQALQSMGQYLLVVKRRSAWVLSGYSEASWSVRQLGDVGAIRPGCITEHDGLVYFIGDDGMYVTDGTSTQEVAGLDKFRYWLKSQIDANRADSSQLRIQMWSFGPFVWTSIPVFNDDTTYTLVYHPDSGSAYLLDLPIVDAVAGWKFGAARLFFATTPNTSKRAILYQYDHPDSTMFDDYNMDDTGLNVQAWADVSWFLKTPWFVFGVHHEERRIRRTWALGKGPVKFTLRGYSDYKTTSEYAISHTLTDSLVTHLEGAEMKDSHAIQFRLAGDKSPASVLGISAITEVRRMGRYKNA